MQITNTNEQIQLMAYRLIRIATRRFDSKMTNEDLGMYVRGVVDLQTELYDEESDRVRGDTDDRSRLQKM